jgi:dolichyl-phosphate-mannose-protein mannosyltransferase
MKLHTTMSVQLLWRIYGGVASSYSSFRYVENRLTVVGSGIYTLPMSLHIDESKKDMTSKESPSYKVLLFFAAIAVAIGVLARIYNLSFPAKAVFDEVYFPVFAFNFLHGIQSFDVHPPLGKLMIAAGIAVFGNTGIGWRIVPVIFGIGLVILSALLGRELTKNRYAFLLAPILFSLDGLLVVYSRVGLMDGVLLCVVLLAFYGALRTGGKASLVCVALLFGIAVSIKWIGIGLLLPLLYVLWRKKKLTQFLYFLPISVIVYGLSVLSGDWIAHDPHPWAAMLEWHKQAFHYHLYLTATHPWSSATCFVFLRTRPCGKNYSYYFAGESNHMVGEYTCGSVEYGIRSTKNTTKTEGYS